MSLCILLLRLRLPERHVRELAENPCTHPHALPFRLYSGGDEAGDDDSEEGIINLFDKYVFVLLSEHTDASRRLSVFYGKKQTFLS